MGGSLTTTGNKSTTDNYQNTATQGTNAPTFNGPQAQSTLAALSSAATSPQTAQDITQAGNTYNTAATTGSPLTNYQTNPYVQGIISNSDALGSRMLSQGEAGVRAQGYGTGDASTMNAQGNYAANFANQQALQDQTTALGQYNTAGTTALTGAAGLGGLGQGQQSLAAQLLAMLRGTSTTGATQAAGGVDTTSTGISATGNAGTNLGGK